MADRSSEDYIRLVKNFKDMGFSPAKAAKLALKERKQLLEFEERKHLAQLASEERKFVLGLQLRKANAGNFLFSPSKYFLINCLFTVPIMLSPKK